MKLYPSAISVISLYNDILQTWKGVFDQATDSNVLEEKYIKTIRVIESHLNMIQAGPDQTLQTEISDISDVPAKRKQHPDSQFSYQPLSVHELVTPEVKEKHLQKKKVNIAPKLRKSMIEPLLMNPISMDDLKLNNSRIDTVLKNRSTLFKAVKLAIRAIPRGK